MLNSLYRWLGRKPHAKAPRRPAGYRPRLENLEERTVLSTYDVGPGMAYTTLNSVPWANLAPGDTVNVQWQPQGYHEKLLLSASGTAAAPIRIVGIAGPDGQLPVIDGQNATSASPDLFRYSGTEARGLIIVSLTSQQPWGYEPSYIQIQGLDLRDASPEYSFTDGTGAAHAFQRNAAGIFVERGEHITITGCTIHNNANGLFVASGGDNATTSRDLLVQNNSIYGNGAAGTDQEHNVYTEADGIVFQYNHFGPLRAGAIGNNLKDRSAGTVVRYNWFDGVPGHLLDLVDSQDGAPLIPQDSAYDQTYVYGNTFVNGPDGSALMIHYGGDDGLYQNYRKGTLYFYNNTLVNESDQSGRWREIVFELDTNDESLDARNNIFYNAPATPWGTPSEFSLLQFAGQGNFGVNWVSPTWLPNSTAAAFTGTVSGTSNFLVDPNNNPGFANLAAADLHLTAGSAAVGQAGPLAAGASPVDQEYVDPQSGTARAGADLGAFAYGAAAGSAPSGTASAPAPLIPAGSATPTTPAPTSTSPTSTSTSTAPAAPASSPSAGNNVASAPPAAAPASATAPAAVADDGAIRVVAPDAGGAPEVKVYDAHTGQLKFDFRAYAPGFTGGVRVAVGDVNGDGVPDIITAPGPGGGPDIHVYDGKTGGLMGQFFAFSPNFTGGSYVAAGDVNGDGRADIIVGADAGGGPNVTAFDGRTGAELLNFLPFDQHFTGGVRVAVTDGQVVAVPGPGGGPDVRAYNGATGAALDEFFAYAPRFSGGLYVAG
jgi:hypothetical protein